MSDMQYTELWSSISEKSRYIETEMDALTRALVLEISFFHILRQSSPLELIKKKPVLC